jgi:CBS domain-containing protein
METSQVRRVRIYLNEQDHWHGRPLSLAILDTLRKHDASGATVFRGIAGFGVHHKIRTVSIELLSTNLPLVVEWIDRPELVEQLLPTIRAMVPEGLITVESIDLAKAAAPVPHRVSEEQTVGQVMTPDPVTVQPESPLRELVELLIVRGYRALPVVNRDGQLVGLVTRGDLIERGGLRLGVELLPALSADAVEQELRRLEAESRMTAADLMTRNVVTVRPKTNLAAAGRLMEEQHLNPLPVLDAGGRVVGIISRVDVLRTVAAPDLAAIAMAAEVPVQTGAGTVGAVMSRQVPAVGAEAGLGEVLAAMVSSRLNRVVVVDGERRPIGVITDTELLRRVEPEAQPGLVQVLMRKLGHREVTPDGARAVDLMLPRGEWVRAETPIGDAIRLMLERQYKILPVVDQDGKLVGLVDRADLLRAIVAE